MPRSKPAERKWAWVNSPKAAYAKNCVVTIRHSTRCRNGQALNRCMRSSIAANKPIRLLILIILKIEYDCTSTNNVRIMFNPFGRYNRFRWIKLTAVLVAIFLAAGTLLTLQRHNQSRADFLFSGLPGGNPNVPTNARVDASWDAVQNKSLSLMSWDPTPGSIS